MPVARRLIALFFPLLLALITLTGCARGCSSLWAGNPDERLPATADAPAPARSAPPALHAPRFSAGQLEPHFRKHGTEMGLANQVEYLRAAQALFRGGPGVETWEREDGDTLYYRAATGEFGVLSNRNVIRTYFKPDDGPRYWERQKHR